VYSNSFFVCLNCLPESFQDFNIMHIGLQLYPYHLADYICRVSRISPFRYYCDILFEAMKNEQPYDSIPNFTAADALRLTGVGRNEFIDIMNKCRSKVFLDMIFGSYTVRCSCNLVNIHRFQIVDRVN